MKARIYGLFLLLLSMSGCILPIPHKRVSVAGCEGVVCDALTGKPINGATVNVMYSGMAKPKTTLTDDLGRYKVFDEKSSHGAFFIGIPVSFSLLPTLDAPSVPNAVSVKANGYIYWEWHSWFDIDEAGNITEVITNKDPSHIELKPEAREFSR